MRLSKRFRSIVRLAAMAAGVPCVYLVGAGAMFYLHHRAANASETVWRLPQEPQPTAATRLLVVAPHCDDETLGCGGLIQQTVQAGGAVRIVVVTNGDGFRTAVERETRRLDVSPADYIQFAGLRQRESLHALADLGVESGAVSFLGYPDQGLSALWNEHWSPDHPYTSSYTRRDRSPYPVTFDGRARYCGADLLADLETVMREFRPTVIAVTHPSEDHPDHAYTAAFLELALTALQGSAPEEAWTRHVRLLHYMIHRGDWPSPQGLHPAASLPPPAEMQDLDTRWSTLPLSSSQIRNKTRSIQAYPSQTSLMGRFLLSFARRTELYGEVPEARLTRVPDSAARTATAPDCCAQIAPALLDPVRDNLLRDLQGSGDIRALYACRDRRDLFLRLDTRQPISPRILYTLRVRGFGAAAQAANSAFVLRVRGGAALGGAASEVSIAVHGAALDARIPLAAIRPSGVAELATVGVSAETSLAGVQIDKTGVRLLRY